jgi:probable F420-dependent oxidoreductase
MMRFGLCLPNYGGKVKSRQLATLAAVAEESRFDSVFVTDHIIVPRGLEDPYEKLLEPLMMLSYLSAKTEKVRLGTSVIVVPQRNPILLAKQLATLDTISGGRTILAAGAGWLKQEFTYLNADFKQRGRILDESIRLMRTLWQDEVINFRGRFSNVRNARFFPKPVQKTIPIWVAGNSPAALRRAIRLGDGWHPVGLAVTALLKAAEKIRNSGRKLEISLRITVDPRNRRSQYTSSGERRVLLSGSRTNMVDQVEAYGNAGAARLVLYFGNVSAASYEDAAKKFARDVSSSFR